MPSGNGNTEAKKLPVDADEVNKLSAVGIGEGCDDGSGSGKADERPTASSQNRQLKVDTNIELYEEDYPEDVAETVEDMLWFCVANLNWMGVGRRILISSNPP